MELCAGADLELAVGMAQMCLDRLDRDEQRLRDGLVAHPIGCELCHAPLARGECVQPRLEDLPRFGTGGGDLVVRPLGEAECSDTSRQVDALPEPLACLGPLVGATQGCPEVDEGAGAGTRRGGAGRLGAAPGAMTANRPPPLRAASVNACSAATWPSRSSSKTGVSARRKDTRRRHHDQSVDPLRSDSPGTVRACPLRGRPRPIRVQPPLPRSVGGVPRT